MMILVSCGWTRQMTHILVVEDECNAIIDNIVEF